MTLQTYRTLGGVGASLMVLGIVSTALTLVRYAFLNSALINSAFTAISGIVSSLVLVGFVLFLVAMYGLSRSYKEHKIFDYILYGIIIGIIAGVITVVFTLVFYFNNLSSFINVSSPTQVSSAMLTLLAPTMAAIGFVSLIPMVFNVLALNLLAKKSQVTLFKKAALIFLASAFVQIVSGIVFAFWAPLGAVSLDNFVLFIVPAGIVQYAAWAVLAFAFFRIPVPPSNPITVSSAAYPTGETGQTKHCPNCGAENRMDSIYCVKCGKKL